MRGNGSGDYTYLGPVGNSATGPFGDNRGNVNGFGIILEDGTDYQKNYQDTNTDGKGNTGGNAWLAWSNPYWCCLLYTSDAADDLLCVDIGGRRILQKKKSKQHTA